MIEPTGASMGRSGRRPRDDVDGRGRSQSLDHRTREPGHPGARVAVLHSRDELARNAFVRERDVEAVETRWSREWRGGLQ